MNTYKLKFQSSFDFVKVVFFFHYFNFLNIHIKVGEQSSLKLHFFELFDLLSHTKLATSQIMELEDIWALIGILKENIFGGIMHITPFSSEGCKYTTIQCSACVFTPRHVSSSLSPSPTNFITTGVGCDFFTIALQFHFPQKLLPALLWWSPPPSASPRGYGDLPRARLPDPAPSNLRGCAQTLVWYSSKNYSPPTTVLPVSYLK